MKPPIAKKVPVEIIKHGDKRIDNYSWLKDKSDPEVIKYLEEENRYTESFMADTSELQEKLYNEMINRIKEDDISCPYRRGDFFYYYKQEKGKNYDIHLRRKAENNTDEEMILDVNEIAEKLNYCAVAFLPSPDNKILAYQVDGTGDFSCTMYFKNMETGKHLEDVLEKTSYCEWSNDNRKVYYVIFEKGNRGKQAFVHTLGQKQSEDVLIYQETDDKYWLSLRKSNSKKFIILTSASITANEEYVVSADDSDIPPKLIEKRAEGVRYTAEHNGDDLYFLTNHEALNYRIMKAPLADFSRENWKEFIPENKNSKIEEMYMFSNYLALQERNYGLTMIKIIDLRNKSHHYVNFPEPIYMVIPEDNYEFESQFIRFLYSSFITPRSYFDHDMEKNRNIPRKEIEILGGYNKEDYITERLLAPAHDGKQIPVSIVYKKSIQKDGTNPLFLYSYGAYGISSETWFTVARLPLLDRGFVFAVAHIRGGGEFGEEWYKEGKMLNKKNTFSDFISCAEFLIEKGYTYKGGISALGGSAGGILMGAIANMRPDLFKCIIAKVPAMDVLNNLFDRSIDNSAVHFGEWGDPNIKEHYDYIKSYSPYENIINQKYPYMLLTTGLNDANVPYSEPAKFTAKIREVNNNESIILLKTDFKTAHFGPSGRYSFLRFTAFDYAFILKCFGIKE